jgi:hypothetical protein
MSSKSGNDNAENFLLFIIVCGLILAGVLYVFYLFLPYLIFYILPFVVGSLVVGFILRMAGEPGDGVLSLSRYRAVVLTYAFCLLVVGITCFSNVTRAVVIDKKGNLTGQYVLDWPRVNQHFNQWRSSTYAGSPFDGLKQAAQTGVIYDRLEVGWILLCCLFLGGPGFYYWLSRNDPEKVNAIVESLVDERTKTKRDQLKNKEENLNQIIESNKAALKVKIGDLEKVRAELLAENQILKAKLEFAPDIPRPSEIVPQDKKGVLDSDLF